MCASSLFRPQAKPQCQARPSQVCVLPWASALQLCACSMLHACCHLHVATLPPPPYHHPKELPQSAMLATPALRFTNCNPFLAAPPDTWVEVVDKKTGLLYYWCKRTGKHTSQRGQA